MSREMINKRKEKLQYYQVLLPKYLNAYKTYCKNILFLTPEQAQKFTKIEKNIEVIKQNINNLKFDLLLAGERIA